MRRLKMLGGGSVPVQYPGDCDRIRKALGTVGIIVTQEYAAVLWENYSEGYCAGWLALPTDDRELIDFLTTEDRE